MMARWTYPAYLNTSSTGKNNMDAISAFRRANFDWTMSMMGVWKDPTYHLADFHPGVVEDVLEAYERLEEDEEAENPIGRVIVGQAGSGKTHLLGQVRREVINRGGTFLLADLTDVRDLWETVLQGAVTSLTRRLPTGGNQLERVLDKLLHRFAQGSLQGLTAAQLAEVTYPALSVQMDELVASMARGTDPHKLARHEPVLRALTLLSSADHDLLSLGEAWLSGLDVREEAKSFYELPSGGVKAMDRLLGLVWIASWAGPVVLAVDQLDAIASEARAVAAGGAHGPETIFTHTANGLMALRELMPRTQVVVSCLESNWQYLEGHTLKSVRDRFSDPTLLKPSTGVMLEQLLGRRLSNTYARAGFTPPYSTYPFKPTCFEGVHLSPRGLLQRAETHRKRCREEGAIRELERFDDRSVAKELDGIGLELVDASFEETRARVDAKGRLKAGGPELHNLLETACIALVKEQPLPPRVDVELDLDFGKAGQVEPLHARVRIIDRDDGDRERHLSLRFIQETHHIAFQTRLTKALTESGVGAGLGFRRLVVYRSEPLPEGAKTEEMVQQLDAIEAVMVEPTELDIQTLVALTRMLESPPEHFFEWLAARKPVSASAMFKDHVEFLFEEIRNPGSYQPTLRSPAAGFRPRSERTAARGHRADRPSPPATAAGPAQPSTTPEPEKMLVLGHEIVGIGEGEALGLSIPDLARHVAILAAAGSGKTVFVKRIIEESALKGVPCLVIDAANDLCRLGQPWPEAPAGMDANDLDRARRYFEGTETIIWTPGSESGNPISVDPMPDFTPLLEDRDELQVAVELAFELLADDLKLTRTGGPNEVRRAILHAAVVAYAQGGGQTLDDLLHILREPGAIASGYHNGEKQAQAVADGLAAAIQLNPMLKSEGTRLDFDELLGRGLNETRVSVVSLAAMPTLERQQAFVGRLMTLLFTYARRNPSQGGLAGLVVLDEAKDFVPARGNAASSLPIKRAAAQLRKYGYGLVVATQEPRSVDHRVVANSSTQVFGKALAPATQEAMQTMMSQLGGQPARLGTLRPGQFFVSVPESPAPRKMQAPWCLSFHGPAPSPDDVRELAAEHRRSLGRS